MVLFGIRGLGASRISELGLGFWTIRSYVGAQEVRGSWWNGIFGLVR